MSVHPLSGAARGRGSEVLFLRREIAVLHEQLDQQREDLSTSDFRNQELMRTVKTLEKELNDHRRLLTRERTEVAAKTREYGEVRERLSNEAAARKKAELTIIELQLQIKQLTEVTYDQLAELAQQFGPTRHDNEKTSE